MQKQSKPCWLCNNMMYSMNVLWGIYAIMNSLSPWLLSCFSEKNHDQHSSEACDDEAIHSESFKYK